MAQAQKKKLFCKNHPGKAGRACFECSTPVCKECQIIIFSKPFCSWKCVRKALWTIVKPQLFKKPSRQWFKKSATILTLAISTFILLILVVMVLATLNIRRHAVQLRLADQVKKAGVVVEQDQEFTIKELPDAMVTSSTINISGQAADSLIISLKVNGKMQQVQLPQNSKFTFENIKLETGSNDLKVIALDASGKTKLLHTLTTTYGTPRLDWLARNISRGNISKKQIALTFDGGSGNGAVANILNILQNKHITSTFFLTGRFIQRYTKDVLRIVEAGHEIGNHTWSHPHLTSFEENYRHDTLEKINKNKLQLELVKTSDKFNQLTHLEMIKFWRAPYGEHNREIRRWAAELGYQQIGWTIGRGETMDTMDWVADTTQTNYHSSQEILQRLIQFGDKTEIKSNGGIILMHLDSQRQFDQAFTILPAYIDTMRAKGYEFVPISTILKP